MPYIENDAAISTTIDMSEPQQIRMTQTTLRILQVFIDDIAREISGADVWDLTKIGAGSRYPILRRLENAGWLTSRWEVLDPRKAGRPARRFYRLTSDGQVWARAALQERGFLSGGLAWT
jgi:hypothetical protein